MRGGGGRGNMAGQQRDEWKQDHRSGGGMNEQTNRRQGGQGGNWKGNRQQGGGVTEAERHTRGRDNQDHTGSGGGYRGNQRGGQDFNHGGRNQDSGNWRGGPNRSSGGMGRQNQSMNAPGGMGGGSLLGNAPPQDNPSWGGGSMDGPLLNTPNDRWGRIRLKHAPFIIRYRYGYVYRNDTKRQPKPTSTWNSALNKFLPCR